MITADAMGVRRDSVVMAVIPPSGNDGAAIVRPPGVTAPWIITYPGGGAAIVVKAGLGEALAELSAAFQCSIVLPEMPGARRYGAPVERPSTAFTKSTRGYKTKRKGAW